MRRNRIKAVIKVPAASGGGPARPPADTPPSILPCASPPPVPVPSSSSPLKSPCSPHPLVQLPPSSSLLRSPQRSTSPMKYPCLALVPSSPESPATPNFHSPPPYHHHHHFQSPTKSAPPDFGTAHKSPRRYSPFSPASADRSSPGPSLLPCSYAPEGGRSTYTFTAPHAFNTNSNSGDSHEVARFMSIGSPMAPPSPLGGSTSRGPDEGPFSSLCNFPMDHTHSIVGNSELLRQRLQKPSPALSVTKYQALRKEFMAKQQSGTLENKPLTMLHFAFFNPPKGEGSRRNSRASSVASERGGTRALSDHDANSQHSLVSQGAPRRATIETTTPSTPPEEDWSAPTESNERTGPRVKVGPDGQLIIDEQSLVVQTSEWERAKKKLSQMETITADFSGTFRNKKRIRRGTDWTVKETVRFYRVLSMCGTDFSMMSTLFPGRTRAELKSKFKREDRRNPGQINAALSCQEFDPDEEITSDEEEELVPPPASSPASSAGIKGKAPPTSRVKKPAKKLLDGDEKKGLLQQGGNKWKCSKELGPTNCVVSAALLKLKEEIGEKGGASSVEGGPVGRSPLQPNKKKKRKTEDCSKEEEEGQKRRTRVKRKPKVGGKRETSEPPSSGSPTLVVKNEKEEAAKKKARKEKNPLMEMLRFDETDPLGHKVPLPRPPSPLLLPTPEPEAPPPGHEGGGEEEGGRLSPRSFLEDFHRVRGAGGVSSEEQATFKVEKEGEKSQGSRVKVLPYRVPGPGPGEVKKGGPPPTLLDEIEIEISCQ